MLELWEETNKNKIYDKKKGNRMLSANIVVLRQL